MTHIRPEKDLFRSGSVPDRINEQHISMAEEKLSIRYGGMCPVRSLTLSYLKRAHNIKLLSIGPDESHMAVLFFVGNYHAARINQRALAEPFVFKMDFPCVPVQRDPVPVAVVQPVG